MHSCTPPRATPGDLEIYCHDGEFGIVETNDPIAQYSFDGALIATAAAHMTPWIPSSVAEDAKLFLSDEQGRRSAGAITVLGHFNDPRAGACRAIAAKACGERFVIDKILAFDRVMVSPPLEPSQPAPDESRPLFDASSCAGTATKYSFVGWTTTKDLGLSFQRQGRVYAMVAAAPVPLGGATWTADPNGSGHEFRVWGRMICIAQYGLDGVIEFGSVPDSSFVEWDDGLTVQGQGVER
jgi:hypothetical protein